jgi:hypothetical protein
VKLLRRFDLIAATLERLRERAERERRKAAERA